MPGFARPLNKRGAIGPKPAAARWLDRQSWFGSEPATPDSEAAQPWSFLQRAWPSPARRWPAPVQAKLVVGQVDDPQEKEADRVAEAVLRLPATAAPPDAHPSPPDGSPHASPGAPPSTHTVQRAPAPGTATPPSSAHTPATALAVSKPTDAAEREADAVAAQLPQGAPGSEPDSNRTSAGPLPAHDRAFFESRFGHELSRVRVHTDHAAAAAASSIGAEAFTVGTDIAFADGRYRPGTDDGRRLLAHELTHVVQQGGASPLPNSPRMAIARSPAVVARKPAPASTPAPAATPEPTQEADEPVDKYKGLAVS